MQQLSAKVFKVRFTENIEIQPQRVFNEYFEYMQMLPLGIQRKYNG